MHSDDLLVIYHQAKLFMKGFDTLYTLKPDAKGKKWAETTTYIGANIEKFQVLDTGETCWILFGDTYIKEAIKNVDLKLAKSGRHLFKTARSPIKLGYQTELDMYPFHEYDQLNYYQNTVGQLIWAVEFRRIKINLEIALLSCYIAQPRHGHLDQVFHTLSFIK